VGAGICAREKNGNGNTFSVRMGMGIGMGWKSWEWEGMGMVKPIPAHLYFLFTPSESFLLGRTVSPQYKRLKWLSRWP